MKPREIKVSAHCNGSNDASDHIRRRSNGSINTDYYIRRSHRQRSLAAHNTIHWILLKVSAFFRGASDQRQSYDETIKVLPLSMKQQDLDTGQSLSRAT